MKYPRFPAAAALVLSAACLAVACPATAARAAEAPRFALRIEGGADVEEVYAFAWLHYAVVGLERRF